MREFSHIKKKILQYLEFKGISKYKFYQETGITNGILSQNNGLSEENILKFLNYYQDISAEWLLRDEGFMLKTECKEEGNNIINKDRNADEANNSAITTLKEIIKEQGKEIGRLEIRCETLERQLQEKVSNVYDASIDPNVRAG